MQGRSNRFIIFILGAVLSFCVDAAPVQLRMSLPFGKRYRANGLIPVVIVLSTEQNFNGRLTAKTFMSRNRVVAPVGVGPGVFRYEVLCNNSADEGRDSLIVRLTNSHGRIVAKRELEIEVFADRRKGTRLLAWVHPTMAPSDVHCAYRNSSGEGQYASGRLCTNDLQQVDRNSRWVHLETTTSFVNNRVHPAELPTDWRMYTALDALVLTKQLSVRLSSEQAKAIAQWCRMGGRLIVDKDVLTSSTLNTAEVADEFNIDIGGQGKGLEHHPFGFGQVTVSHRPLEAFMIDNNAMPKLMQLFCKEGVLQEGDRSDTYRYYDPWGGADAAPWTGAMCSWTNLERIPGPLIILYFFIFVMAVTVGEWLLLKRFGKQHLTWVITPAFVVLFCVCAGLISRAIRGVKSRYTCLTIEDYRVDGGGGCRQSLACLVPSGAGGLEIGLPEASVVSIDYSGRSGPSTTMSPDGRTGSVAAPVWSHNLLRTCSAIASPAPFTATLVATKDGKEVRGEVVGSDPELPARDLLLLFRGKLFTSSGGKQWKLEQHATDQTTTTRLLDSSKSMWADHHLLEFGPGVSGFPTEIANLNVLLESAISYRKDSPLIFPHRLPTNNKRLGVLVAIARGGGPNLAAPKVTKALRVVRQVVRVKEKAQ